MPHDDLGFVANPHDDLGFEPATPKAKADAKPEAPGAAMSLVHGGVDAIPFGQKFSALLQASALRAAKALGVSGGKYLDDTYPGQLARLQAENAAAAEAHPVLHGTGELVGGAASMAAAPLKGAGLAAAAGNAGIYGAAHGAGASDWSSPAAALLRTTLEGGGMAAAGAGGHFLGKGAAYVAGRVAPGLTEAAIAQGRRVLTNGADSMSKRGPIAAEAVQEALDSKAVRAFGTTKGTLERLQGLTEQQGETYGKLVSSLEEKGVKGPRAQELADELMQKAIELDPRTMNEALPRAYMDEAGKVLTKADPAGRLSLSQSEDLKRSLQAMAKYGRVEETPLNEVRRGVAGSFRNATEQAIDEAGAAAGEGTELRAMADRFVPVKQRLGRLIEAEQAAERGTARGAQRRHFSATDHLLMAGEMATGHPGALAKGAALAVGNNFLRNRGTSTIAAGANSLAGLLQGLGRSEAVPAASSLAASGLERHLSPEDRLLIELLSSPQYARGDSK